MRLALDVTPLSVPRTGIGNYVLGTLRGMRAACADGDELVAVALADAAGAARIRQELEGLDVERVIRAAPAANVVRRGWAAAGRPGIERLVGPVDALHVTDWWHPPQRAGVRATTIHDLVPLRFPQWTTRRTRLAHRATYRHAARACDLVFVNSHGTRRAVEETLGIPGGRIRVAYPGVDPSFAQEGERADLGRPYVLTVATLEPRKNLAAALAAHSRLGPGTLLVVAGGRGWGPVPSLAAEDVRWTGYVGEDELRRLYRGASAFLFPSRFEGFGMPVVEAMASGVPVVASSDPSLDEACGDAALRASPDDPAALADALREVLAGRPDLVARGLEHAARFTWEGAGRVMMDAFREAAGRQARSA